MNLKRVKFDETLFNKDTQGNILTGSTITKKNGYVAYLLVYTDTVEGDSPLIVLKDTSVVSELSDITKAENLALMTSKPVLVPILQENKYIEQDLDEIISAAEEELYGLDIELGDGIILVGFDVELEDTKDYYSLADDGLEELVTIINDLYLKNDIKGK